MPCYALEIACQAKIGIHHSKRQQITCCIYTSRTADIYENSAIVHSWIKKTGSELSEMWQQSCVNWIPFIATKRKKETRSDEQNGLPKSSKMVQMYLECRAPEVG